MHVRVTRDTGDGVTCTGNSKLQFQCVSMHRVGECWDGRGEPVLQLGSIWRSAMMQKLLLLNKTWPSLDLHLSKTELNVCCLSILK